MDLNDIVYDHRNQPVKNAPPEEIVEFLRNRTDEENASCYVMHGMSYYTVKEYLRRSEK